MIAQLVLSILVAFLLGFLLVWRAWPASMRILPLLAVMALPAGWALTSALYFFWLIVSGGRSGWFPAVELGLLAAAVLAALRHRRAIAAAGHNRIRVFRSGALISLVFLGTAVICLAIPVRIAALNPWGRWDAWSRINLKARFLFAGGDQWTWIFHSPRIPHGDYPLLVEAAVARKWIWTGEIAPLAPQTLSLLWGVLLLLALYGMVAWLRGPVLGAITGLACLTFMPLLFLSAIQYADIPLACCMVLGCGMLVAVQEHPEDARHFGFLAGVFAGAAAWCKHEGIVFLLLAGCWWGALALRGRLRERGRATAWFFIGVALCGGAVLVLKTAYAGPFDLGIAAGPDAPSLTALLNDGVRHRLILEKLWGAPGQFWKGWPLLLLAGAFIVERSRARARLSAAGVGPLAVAASLVAVFYLAYLTSRYDLAWHIDTSLNRLLGEVWPVVLLGMACL